MFHVFYFSQQRNSPGLFMRTLLPMTISFSEPFPRHSGPSELPSWISADVPGGLEWKRQLHRARLCLRCKPQTEELFWFPHGMEDSTLSHHVQPGGRVRVAGHHRNVFPQIQPPASRFQQASLQRRGLPTWGSPEEPGLPERSIGGQGMGGPSESVPEPPLWAQRPL